MSKRSTNFTGKKPMKGSHVLSLMQWLGMTDEEIKAALERQKERQMPAYGYSSSLASGDFDEQHAAHQQAMPAYDELDPRQAEIADHQEDMLREQSSAQAALATAGGETR